MRNRIIDVFRIANRLVSITVEDPDFSELRVNQFVKITVPFKIRLRKNGFIYFIEWVLLAVVI